MLIFVHMRENSELTRPPGCYEEKMSSQHLDVLLRPAQIKLPVDLRASVSLSINVGDCLSSDKVSSSS